MLVPQFWAEARAHQPRGKKQRQITVRRFGWSDTSQTDAQSMADARASDALRRLARGERLARQEPKVAYNGAAGVPIREEVLARKGDVVITRNAYGAHCLNTPDVLFADIDFVTEPGWIAVLVYGIALIAVAVTAALAFHLKWLAIGAIFVGVLFAYPLAHATHRITIRFRGGAEPLALRRVRHFVQANRDWNLRVYRTPAGLRVLATHATFAPRGPEVAQFFAALAVDPVYRRMCTNQNCFRARLTAKPWRIGIGDHLRPRPGVWPVNPERLPQRRTWIERYERLASNYSACQFVEEIGSGLTHSKVAAVRDLHDSLSGALAGCALA